ncbi:MAG TPA: outer membrane protein assembly factor BamA [Hyphomicrobium sp.]|nr:outer membrane protein assembly factor BamA [Hyphomicrobium sp.]
MRIVQLIVAGALRLLVVAALAGPMVALGGVTVWQSTAHAQGVIKQIEVTGNRRVEPETVRSYLQVSPGDTYTAAKGDQSIKALFATGLFADVSMEQQGSTLIVHVVENPVINQVAFEGNSEVDTATLAGEVQLKARSVFTRARVQADVQRILDVYRRQGRFAATVEPQIIQLEQDRVNLVFEINEGGATKVKGINFVGNHAFSDSQLRDIVSTTQTGWFDFLKGTSIYDPDRMSLDRELLRQYYLKNGFADATVTAGSAELDPDGSGFIITFAIEEGEAYNFGAVNIESSLPEIQPEAYQGELLTVGGDVYNASLIDKTTEKLTLKIAEQGYAFARVRPRAIPDTASRTIAITYQVDEGPRIYIERINIIGNERTKDFVIRREFRLAEGDAYNPLMVDRAKKRLEALGLFKAVDVKRSPGSAQDRVVLDVMITEQSTGELSFGAGYSTSEGVIGDVSITERNLFGNGQFVRLRLAGSIERMQIDLSFTEPRFLDRNLSAGFDLYHKEIDMRDQAGFRQRKSGGQVRLGFPLAENLWMQTSYGLSRDQIFGVEPNASVAIKDACGALSFTPGTEPNCQNDSYWTSVAGTSITYDGRNHPRNPTRGIFLQLDDEFAGLGGDVQYWRVNAEGRAYYPLTEKITLIGRVVGGHIQGWGGDDVRILDSYFKGGETIRGFDRSGYGPRDITPNGQNDALGGTTYWAATAEVRFPLPFIPEDIGLSGAVFADVGSLFDVSDRAASVVTDNCPAGQICLADDSTIRSSVGASLMWNSPVGPLRMDFAKVLSKQSYDEEQMFRFGASTKF